MHILLYLQNNIYTPISKNGRRKRSERTNQPTLQKGYEPNALQTIQRNDLPKNIQNNILTKKNPKYRYVAIFLAENIKVTKLNMRNTRNHQRLPMTKIWSKSLTMPNLAKLSQTRNKPTIPQINQ